MAELEFTRGPMAGKKIALSDTDLVIGRGSGCNLVLADPEASGRHAEIRQENGTWLIKDLQSSNGTLVNDRPTETATLKNGDTVEIGGSLFTFRDAAAPIPSLEGEAAPSPSAREGEPAVSRPVPEPRPGRIRHEPPPASDKDVALVQQMNARTNDIREEVGKVIVGQRDVLDQILMCMIADGHALLVGLPGMAKTLMVRTIAQVLDLEFKRIQFTPDLMPTDIIGTDVLETDKDTGEKEFRFIKGPIFCNLLLGDEINRTPPKTQAALLEAMQEKRVTAGTTTYELDAPFFVLATQNPIEQEGTYPLPEAQLDRFMFNIWVAYPEEHEEEEIIDTTTTGALPQPGCILKKEDVLQLQEVVRKIPVSTHVVKYAIRLVRATRPEYPTSPEMTRKYVSTGAGPRAGQYLVLAAKARAVLDGRIHVSCNDIRAAAIPVLRHRILTNFAADSEGLRPMDVVNRLLDEIKEPDETTYTNQIVVNA